MPARSRTRDIGRESQVKSSASNKAGTFPRITMRRLTWLPVAALTLFALPAFAQGILPPSLSGWASQGSPANQAPAPMNNAQSSAFREYGYLSGENQSYVQGSDRIDVTLYKFKDPSGAYGAYSFLRQPDMAKADLTQHSSISGRSRPRAHRRLGFGHSCDSHRGASATIEIPDFISRATRAGLEENTLKPETQETP